MHPAKKLILTILILALSTPALASPPAMKGMALGLFSKQPGYTYEKELRELKTLGVNTLLLMIPWYQKNIRTNEIYPRYSSQDPEYLTIPDKELIKLIQRARQAGFKILLLPYLRFEQRGPNEWRGRLDPKNFLIWAQSYEKFILHYANLAQSQGVDVFSVGSELGSMDLKTEFWRTLIGKVRQVFRGKLTYSANWDHYDAIGFWGELDLIGISSYYKISESWTPELREMLANWRVFKETILAFQRKHPKQKILLTEVGYPSMNGAARAPWNYLLNEKVDLEEQSLCYQAAIQTWSDTPELEGIFWWVWYDEGGPQDRNYTPRGKPAGELLKRWYAF